MGSFKPQRPQKLHLSVCRIVNGDYAMAAAEALGKDPVDLRLQDFFAVDHRRPLKIGVLMSIVVTLRPPPILDPSCINPKPAQSQPETYPTSASNPLYINPEQMSNPSQLCGSPRSPSSNPKLSRPKPYEDRPDPTEDCMMHDSVLRGLHQCSSKVRNKHP